MSYRYFTYSILKGKTTNISKKNIFNQKYVKCAENATYVFKLIKLNSNYKFK